MVYDRNPGGSGSDHGDRDYGGGRDFRTDSARDYPASGGYGRGGSDRGASDRSDRAQREYGNAGYRRYDQPSRNSHAQQDFTRQNYGGRSQGREDFGSGSDWRGGYASGDGPFDEVRRYRNADDDDRGRHQQHGRNDYGGQPHGYEDDRGFLQRAGDEVRSWFGDEEAERRREADGRYEEQADRSGGGRHDDDYRQWRNTQVSQLDRDYHEYREENRAKFENEFTNWRTSRQGQRDLLRQVKEHAEVVGSDGEHVGTVDKTRDDRILLTKTDADAGGRHHSIPSRWISHVEDQKVTLSKTAAEAKAAWEDEDRTSALLGYGDNQRDGQRGRDVDGSSGGVRDTQGRVLNRSFSGTY
jgi:hypothetical protein